TKAGHEFTDIQRGFLHLWKPLAVIKPSYILRVGLDETLRSWSTIGMTEWLKAQRWTRPMSAAWEHVIPREEAAVRLKVRIPNPDGTEQVIDHVEQFPTAGA